MIINVAGSGNKGMVTVCTLTAVSTGNVCVIKLLCSLQNISSNIKNCRE